MATLTKGTLDLGAQIREKNEAVKSLFARIDGEQSGVGTPEQQQEIIGLNKEIEEMERSYKSLEQQDTIRAGAEGREAWLRQTVTQFQHGGGVPESRGDQAAIKATGEGVLASEEMQAWLKAVSPNGKVAEKIKLQSPPVNFECGLKSLMGAAKALVTGSSATLGGPFINPDYQGLLDTGVWRRPLMLQDMVRIIRTNSDTVEFIRLGTPTNAAAPVAEATATGGSSGAKPESTIATAAVTETIKTIATWIPATRRALADAPALRDLIDEFLRYALMEEVEDQMIQGSGAGENFTGVRNTANVQSQAYDTSLLKTSRKAVTLVQLNGRAEPNAWVMHPNDWEDFDLLTDNEARYYMGGPAVMGSPRLWGRPVIVSEAAVEGEAILGDWRMAVLWDRQQTAIYMSDSHSDFFVRNLLAILAELRAGFSVIRPQAFVKVDLTP